MKFSKFSKYLTRLEATTKRLEITGILAELIKELSDSEIDKAMYMSLGSLGPLFNQTEFQIADKMMIRVIALAYSEKEDAVNKLYSKEGDLGNVAEIISNKKKLKSKEIELNEVYEQLLKVAQDNGNGSQERKVGKLADLLKSVDSLSARYLVRIPLKNLRLGFSEVTIIEALSWSASGDKSLKNKIENYFHVYPDIGRISKLFKKEGLKSLEEVELEVGVPILPQLCQRAGTAEEAMEKLGGVAGCEVKYDGTRVQLHLDKKRKMEVVSSDQLSFFGDSKGVMPFVKTFTRNLEDSTHMFPDLIIDTLDYVECESAILDGEAVGFDPKTGKIIPFQETSQRKRKHDILETAKEIPLRYFVFDIIYLNGESLINKPLSERREILKKIIKKNDKIVLGDQKVIKSPLELTEEFTKAKKAGLEGIVLKRPNSLYEAGGRGYEWVKFKREETGGLEDTIDGVILGYYVGRGARAQFGIGGFLVGVYDKVNEKFLTVSKVGSGPTEAEWGEIKKRVDKIKSKEKPSNYEVSKNLTCDVWANPEIMVVIRADEITVSTEHTAGYALRFPRLMDFRNDKRAIDSTTKEEIEHLYKLQKK